MPGSGKSTIAQLLAEKIDLPFFDLDLILEIMKGKPIAKIFTEDGEEEFRKMESNAFLSLVASNEPYVMATGGGTPCFFNHLVKMNEFGRTVFLDTPIDTLIARVKDGNERPLLMDDYQNKMKELLSERIDFYKQAQIKVITDKKSLVEITEEIVGLIS
ncbi:MAG: shikimate kinase [Bacteroidetes bacterium]|nr:MAG: shikimate kinase [Bacteroidota bacterium]